MVRMCQQVTSILSIKLGNVTDQQNEKNVGVNVWLGSQLNCHMICHSNYTNPLKCHLSWKMTVNPVNWHDRCAGTCVNGKMCKYYSTNDRFVAAISKSTKLLTAHTFISLLSWTESFTFVHAIVLPSLSLTPQGGLWIDTTGLYLTNCLYLPATLLSEVSHIHDLLLLLKAVGRRNDLARNSSVTWVCAVTSQPAAHPYMEPCPIRTIKCKRAVTLSTQHGLCR